MRKEIENKISYGRIKFPNLPICWILLIHQQQQLSFASRKPFLVPKRAQYSFGLNKLFKMTQINIHIVLVISIFFSLVCSIISHFVACFHQRMKGKKSFVRYRRKGEDNACMKFGWVINDKKPYLVTNFQEKWRICEKH